MKKYKSVFKEVLQNKSCLEFSSYEEYEDFVNSIGGVYQIDFEEALYEACINNGLTRTEARTFLMRRFTSDQVSSMRLYKDRLVVEATTKSGIEFGQEIEGEDPNTAGFTIIYYFKDEKWQWGELF